MKRCARCLLVTYCSKECQTISWKSSHKLNCMTHPSNGNVSPSNSGEPVSKAERPTKFSPEWIELQVDKSLSRWLEIWRSSFQTWTAIALDLANHPADRVTTHCMQLVVQPRNFEDDDAKQYQVIEASVVPISTVQTQFPELQVHIDPLDLTRLRFVVILQNYKGEVRRLRFVQWNDLNVYKWREISKTDSSDLYSGWADVLMDSVDKKDPQDVEDLLGGKRS